MGDTGVATALMSGERELQRDFWREHSSEPTVEAMMLDSKASEIDPLERPEVLGLLGEVDGKNVLEIGAGIGRFTGELARISQTVTAVDFMESSIAENSRRNGHFRNVTFEVGDATDLKLPNPNFDVVFSNWLLMYLSNEEVLKLAVDMLTWIPEGGIVFFRESCFRQSGDKKRTSNPTHYRNPREYFQFFDAAEIKEADGSIAHFELVICKCIDTYVKVKRNQNQICWKWKKVVTRSPRSPHFRQFLDEKQYSSNGILRYERVFGEGFVSTGGLKTTQKVADMMRLQAGERVLDVGCGIGGGDFYLASKYNVHVHGLDLSVNMVLIALERAAGLFGSDITFEVADCMTRDFPEGAFDVIYSRDTILHIADKPLLFSRFHRWLKPGGRLLITDYCRADGEPSNEFAEYIKQRGYDLHSVAAYGKMLQKAGFSDVKAEDWTHQFEECLRSEVKGAQEDKQRFINDFSEEDFNAIVSGWQDKLRRVAEGEQRWGLFLACKNGTSK